MAWKETVSASGSVQLAEGATVAVIGGGPAGAFFALELLRQARDASRKIKVCIFERRSSTPNTPPGSRTPLQTASATLSGAAPGAPPCWLGCNYCAGGISPRLYDLLRTLNLQIPPEVIQSRVQSITIQGFWKNIEIEVPPHRRMLSVFRGSRPTAIPNKVHSFDSFLLDQAIAEGAELIPAQVVDVTRGQSGFPVIEFRKGGDSGEALSRLTVDFCVFACGVNEHGCGATKANPMLAAAMRLMPGFKPPANRRTLIFELAARPEIPALLRDSIFFVEYGSRKVPLEMCSIVPKRECITVVLIGEAVDRISAPAENRELVHEFLRLPHIRRLLSPVAELHPVCLCSPRMVVGVAQRPYGYRVSAVGDLVASRLYKDGILSAHHTARALVEAMLQCGVDSAGLRAGYASTLGHFRRNTRYAGLVFFIHRLFFSSSVLSRVLYQAVIGERKTTPAYHRQLEGILWRIASGDDEYGQILRYMFRPATIRAVLFTGALVTLRNYLTEAAFGLKWEGFAGYTTGVSLERLEEKRQVFKRLIHQANIALSRPMEFERMYTIKIAAPRELILEQLENFGEPDRQYLCPRGVRIKRSQGSPHEPGCEIRYEILSPRLSFTLRLEKVFEDHLAVYRVMNGFARGGVLLFEIETGANGVCLLSIYVAFNFNRGGSAVARAFWGVFRLLFPAFVHDVIWNHSLCQLRDIVEKQMHPTTPSAGAGTPEA
jgi:flavin-dependent dehydrogenase